MLSRRQWLIRSGWLATGVTVIGACDWRPASRTTTTLNAADTLTWLQITPSGDFLFYCPRSEMGQGIATGLRKLLAEELRVDERQIQVELPRTDQIPAAPATMGSNSMQSFFQPVAMLGARLRETLRARLADQQQTTPERLRLASGGFIDLHNRHVRYRDLVVPQEDTIVAADAIGSDTITPPQLLSLDPVHENQSVGISSAVFDIEQMVTGKGLYSRDVTLANMQFGWLAKPPTANAQLVGLNRDAKLPVGSQLIDGPEQTIGVIAVNPMLLSEAIQALQLDWSTPAAAPFPALDIDTALANPSNLSILADKGDQPRGQQNAKHKLNLRYQSPWLAHAAMEPRAACARVTGTRLEIWTASQDPWYVQRRAAEFLSWPRSNIVVHNYRLGGSFGGRLLCQAALESAWLAIHSRQPVKVQWSREDEFHYNHAAPRFSHRIQCGITAAGEISHWDHAMVTATLESSPDQWTQRGLVSPYRIANQRARYANVAQAFAAGSWRGLGTVANTFASECAMDELALAAQLDPLSIRLDHLAPGRLRQVLENVARMSQWQRQRGPGYALGLASCVYNGATFVAVVAEVLQTKTGPTLTKLWCAQDCGLVVSPDQVRAQVEGNLVWGISMAQRERLNLSAAQGGADANNGQLTGTMNLNFDQYPIARQQHTPALDISLVDSQAPPTGAGEAALAPTAAAIANALARATGQRQRVLPLAFESTLTGP